ncbi:hypothetical protein F5X97DRAFT_138905 [Nemania serpens]|nr:hypothetical protein F5X97DRAFT_138905 [Nemania serpens]
MVSRTRILWLLSFGLSSLCLSLSLSPRHPVLPSLPFRPVVSSTVGLDWTETSFPTASLLEWPFAERSIIYHSCPLPFLFFSFRLVCAVPSKLTSGCCSKQ